MTPLNSKKQKGGYTIIETMIAISLFVIIVMLGMNSLLNAGLLNQKSHDLRSIMDNLSFIMEDMSRNIQTGSEYRCISSNDNSDFSTTNVGTAKSGETCWGIAFEPAKGDPENNDDQWVYYIGTYGSGNVGIFKSTNGGISFVQLTPDEVVIDQSYGFSVLGAEGPSVGDKQQPFITVKLVGHISYKNVVTPFFLETSASERAIDI